MWQNESKIMKYRVSSGYVDKILAEEPAIFKIKLLDGYSLTSAGENNSEKLFHSVHQYAPFLSNIVHHLFASFPPGSKKQEKCALHPSIRDLAVGFWVGRKGRETVLPSFL